MFDQKNTWDGSPCSFVNDDFSTENRPLVCLRLPLGREQRRSGGI